MKKNSRRLVMTIIFFLMMFISTNVNAQDNMDEIPESQIEENILEKENHMLEIEMEYKYNEENNTVIAIMYSNEELKDTKTTWKLSEDKLTYTNENMTSNGSYHTGVKDKWGNESEVLIDIKIIDDKPPEISMEYVYNSNDTVKVIMHSNEEMADTKKSWELSEDKYTYINENLSSNGSI